MARRRTTTAAALIVSSAMLLGLQAPAHADGPGPVTPSAVAQTADMASGLTATAAGSRYLGRWLSAVVIDPADGTVVWRHHDEYARMPASTQKLLTAYTVLTSMKPDTTLATTTCTTAAAPSRVFVRGGGDPSLSSARIQALAAQTASALRKGGRTRVTLTLDASFFPAPSAAPGWTASYLRSDVQYVRGLTVAGYRGGDGRVAVGKLLVAALKKRGVTASVAGTGVTPSGCRTVATTRSAPVRQLVAGMLARSDNDYAEFLLRHAALARGNPATWRGALDNEFAVLRLAGVPTLGLQAFDGSGLSRANRMPVATLAATLRVLRADPRTSAVVFAPGALPVAGETGTLADRFTTPQQACARGQVRAKTGTLADAVSLAGVAVGADGKERIFAFLTSGLRQSDSVRSALDTLSAEVVCP